MAHYYGGRRHRLNADEVPLVRGLVLEKLAELPGPVDGGLIFPCGFGSFLIRVAST